MVYSLHNLDYFHKINIEYKFEGQIYNIEKLVSKQSGFYPWWSLWFFVKCFEFI